MNLTAGGRKMVETHAEPFQALLNQFVVAFHHFCGRHSFFFRRNRNRHAMFVDGAHIHNVALLQALIAHVNIRRQVGARQMSDMQRPIGIGQRAGH